MSSLAQFRLHITLQSVRDLAVPLGSFANIYCAWIAPPLAGSQAGRRVRTAPPVLLPHHGVVALPITSSMRYEFSAELSQLFDWFAHQPIQIEIWHSDRYTTDVLLGVAILDLSEIFGVNAILSSEKAIKASWTHDEHIVAMNSDGSGVSSRVAIVHTRIVLEHMASAPSLPLPCSHHELGSSTARMLSERPHSPRASSARKLPFSPPSAPSSDQRLIQLPTERIGSYSQLRHKPASTPPSRKKQEASAREEELLAVCMPAMHRMRTADSPDDGC